MHRETSFLSQENNKYRSQCRFRAFNNRPLLKDSIREMKVITSTMFSMKRGELRPYPQHANAFKSSTPKTLKGVLLLFKYWTIYLIDIDISCPLYCSVMTFNRDVQCMDMRLQYLSTSTVELLISHIITIIMLIFIFSTRFFIQS